MDHRRDPRLGLPASPPTDLEDGPVPAAGAGPLDTPRPPAARRRRVLLAAAAGAVIGTLATFGLLAGTGLLDGRGADQSAAVDRVIERTTLVEEGTGALLGSPDQIRNVAAATIPSIVTVEVSANAGAPFADGSGSGVIFDEAGFIITNDHVIAEAAEIKVVLSDGLTYTARLIGTDPVMDIAVLAIDATGLPPVPFADIESVEVGDLAIAIGNPLGLDGGPSVTTGVVSALDRRLDTVDATTGHSNLFGLLQTDAPITRGSSGGALVNGDGELIGITTAIGLSDVGAEGLGFAVPVDLLEELIDDLVEDGIVRHAFLGISGVPAFDVQASGVEVPIGARITEIVEGSPLGEAGARVDDVIVALDNEPITSMTLLVAHLRHYRAGQQVEVTVSRDGTPMTLSITLDERPED